MLSIRRCASEYTFLPKELLPIGYIFSLLILEVFVQEKPQYIIQQAKCQSAPSPEN